MQFFTIGVYNSIEQEFFNTLIQNKIDTFCDIRQRRAVRGSQYSFVNSNRLQGKLSKLGIKYIHILKLGAPAEVREVQKKADAKKGEGYRKREVLDKDFIAEYKKKVLKKFNFKAFIEELQNAGSKKVVLFCVEEKPEACHRSIAADELRKKYNYKVNHI